MCVHVCVRVCVCVHSHLVLARASLTRAGTHAIRGIADDCVKDPGNLPDWVCVVAPYEVEGRHKSVLHKVAVRANLVTKETYSGAKES